VGEEGGRRWFGLVLSWSGELGALEQKVASVMALRSRGPSERNSSATSHFAINRLWADLQHYDPLWNRFVPTAFFGGGGSRNRYVGGQFLVLPAFPLLGCLR
jgi:hypothetical protein